MYLCVVRSQGVVPRHDIKQLRNMKKVRIRFAADICVEGEDMKEVVSKWRSIPLFTEEAISSGADFLEVEAVDDCDTGEDLSTEFNNS